MKKNENIIYLFANMAYLIPGTFCAIGYYNFFYRIFEYPDSHLLGNIIGIIFIIPYLLFYIMGLTFTILVHPIIQIILFILTFKEKIFSRILIIYIFIHSIIISIIYLYLIWVKGYILTV